MAGIYIHIPFCKQKCTYCDFHFSTTFEVYRSAMIDSIVREIESRKGYLENQKVRTIYFGGGTPSILKEDEIQAILSKVYKVFDVVQVAEITLEANPDDINSENLKVWKKAGVNRLSIGLQSFKKSDLEWMNRAHTVQDSFQCVKLAKQHGFEDITVDLMYGLPDLTMKEWENHIQEVLDLNVPHVSAYCLTVEKKTVLSNLVGKGKIVPASEDQQSDQFLKLLKKLEAKGFEQYEISNFSKPGHESKHNSNYWKGEWYLGVGPSAHSFNGTSRSWNIRNNARYILEVKENGDYNESETLSKVNQFNERILIGLRTKYGVNMKELARLSPISVRFLEVMNDFMEKGWAFQENESLVLTKEGKLRADYIASELFYD
ncbi:MAG: radical SAM family heme chaperone HemW [Crocinitomicaceae bacterium]